MAPLIIAHAEDPDGILARALLMRQFPAGQKHVFVRYDRIAEAFDEAVTKAGGCSSVYVADVNPTPGLVQAGGSDFTLLEKLAAGREVYWFDHHGATLQHKDKLAELGIKVYHQENQRAALIIHKHYQSSDLYETRLAKIAQAHDYKNNHSDHENIKIGDQLEKIIALANEKLNHNLLLDLSLDLQKEKCFDTEFALRPKWQYYVNQFTRREQAAYRELDNTVEITNVGNHKVLFGYSSPLLSQKNGPDHLCKKYLDRADIFVCLFKSPVRNHIVSAPGKKFSVVPFVKNLDGGGDEHRNSGGFTLDYDVTSANYAAVKGVIVSELEKYLHSNSA